MAVIQVMPHKGGLSFSTVPSAILAVVTLWSGGYVRFEPVQDLPLHWSVGQFSKIDA